MAWRDHVRNSTRLSSLIDKLISSRNRFTEMIRLLLRLLLMPLLLLRLLLIPPLLLRLLLMLPLLLRLLTALPLLLRLLLMLPLLLLLPSYFVLFFFFYRCQYLTTHFGTATASITATATFTSTFWVKVKHWIDLVRSVLLKGTDEGTEVDRVALQGQFLRQVIRTRARTMQRCHLTFNQLVNCN